LATNMAVRSLLNAIPFAPKGGTPFGVKIGSCTQIVPPPPPGPVFQIIPWKESETYTFVCAWAAATPSDIPRLRSGGPLSSHPSCRGRESAHRGLVSQIKFSRVPIGTIHREGAADDLLGGRCAMLEEMDIRSNAGRLQCTVRQGRWRMRTKVYCKASSGANHKARLLRILESAPWSSNGPSISAMPTRRPCLVMWCLEASPWSHFFKPTKSMVV